MKYKTLLLLIFTLILTQTIYGQYQKVVDPGGGGGSWVSDTSQWSDNMRLDVYGELVPISMFNFATTVSANIKWHDGVPRTDGGPESITGSYNITIGVGDKVSISTDIGANGGFSLRMVDMGKGCAALYIVYTGAMGTAAKLGGAYPVFIGYVFEDYPDKLFNDKGQLIDPKTRKPILDPKTKKPITKKQLDAERDAAAAAANSGTGSSGGGSGGGGGGGGLSVSLAVVYYPDGILTGTTYGVSQNGQIVGYVTYNNDGTITIIPKPTPDGKPPVTADQLKKATDKYRSE